MVRRVSRDPSSGGESFDLVVGSALRRAREAAGLSLQDLARRSGGRFKASTVAGYERGERSISIRRFIELATFYRELPDRLLANVLEEREPTGRRPILVDESRLAQVEEPARRIVIDLIRRVREERRDYQTEVVTLRSGDLEFLSLVAEEDLPSFLDKLRPALAGTDNEQS